MFSIGDQVRIITNDSHPYREQYDKTRDQSAGAITTIAGIESYKDGYYIYRLSNSPAGYNTWPDFLLVLSSNPNFTSLHLPTGVIITLTDGTRIYQPNIGNPIQLLKDPNDPNRPTIT